MLCHSQICKLKTGKLTALSNPSQKTWQLGEEKWWFDSVSPGSNWKTQESGALISKGKKRRMSQLKRRVNLLFLNLKVLLWPSTVTVIGLLIQTLISSRDNLTDTTRNVLLGILVSLTWVKFTHKLIIPLVLYSLNVFINNTFLDLPKEIAFSAFSPIVLISLVSDVK